MRLPWFPPAVLLLASLLVYGSGQAFAVASDERFLAAREAYRVGDRARLERMAEELRGHVLEAYPDYWRLSIRLEEQDSAALHAFLSRYDRSWLAERLRNDWLKVLGKQQRWDIFESVYSGLVQAEPEVNCYYLRLRQARGEQAAFEEAMALWLNGLDAPEACQSLLASMLADKRVSNDTLWLRIRRQFEANKIAAARSTLALLPTAQAPTPRQLNLLVDQPLLALNQFSGDTPSEQALLALAIQRIARNDPRQAAIQLQKILLRFGDTPTEKAAQNTWSWAWSQIATQAAMRHWPEALSWYKKAGDTALSDESAQWKVRAALRVQDWGLVRSTIEKMPKSLARLPDWTYWLGRAYKASGQLEEARRLWQKIAGQANFYGNLANDELDRPTQLPPKTNSPSQEELRDIATQPGLKRAIALFQLNLRTEAVREWNWSLRGMNDRQLLAAAELAQSYNLFDRAIAAADRTQTEHDYSLRYLAPFADQVRPAAQKQSIDDAWVYGLMRQESRFVTQAKSSVGASGLMQLMPATAKWVAKKIGLNDYHHGQVNDTETNLLLGTSYMRLVMDSLDQHPVLASAAYNAGPGRARKWRAEIPLEGAIYAETIPFSETRDYVKKVMSNAVYYALLFEGKPQSLKTRLGTVGARTELVRGEDLP